jgi:hypothetical protein
METMSVAVKKRTVDLSARRTRGVSRLPLLSRKRRRSSIRGGAQASTPARHGRRVSGRNPDAYRTRRRVCRASRMARARWQTVSGWRRSTRSLSEVGRTSGSTQATMVCQVVETGPIVCQMGDFRHDAPGIRFTRRFTCGTVRPACSDVRKTVHRTGLSRRFRRRPSPLGNIDQCLDTSWPVAYRPSSGARHRLPLPMLRKGRV